MDSKLDEKRRELFELHKAKIGTDAPLMRRPIVTQVAERKVQEVREPISNRDKIKYAVFVVTGLVVVIELVFLAKEAGWFR